MTYKFSPGDRVKIANFGQGCASTTLDKIVTIEERGEYIGAPGYRIKETDIKGTNSYKEGDIYPMYDGYIGEDSFELYQEETIIPQLFN